MAKYDSPLISAVRKMINIFGNSALELYKFCFFCLQCFISSFYFWCFRLYQWYSTWAKSPAGGRFNAL